MLMSKKKTPKTKKEIVSDIQLVQDATRRRSLIKEILFPFLVKTDESIAYSKIFLQSFAGMVEGVYEENRKKTTIGFLEERLQTKLQSIFTLSNPEQKKEYERYMELVKLLEHISIQDFAYAAELPRFMDGYMMQDIGKKSIKEIPIDEILGK